jgi:hypothetical protein
MRAGYEGVALLSGTKVETANVMERFHLWLADAGGRGTEQYSQFGVFES